MRTAKSLLQRSFISVSHLHLKCRVQQQYRQDVLFKGYFPYIISISNRSLHFWQFWK